MGRDKKKPYKPYRTVYSNHYFFWNTELTDKEMAEINKWIGDLDPKHKQLLDKLLVDYAEADANEIVGDRTGRQGK